MRSHVSKSVCAYISRSPRVFFAFIASQEKSLRGHHGFETDNWSRERIAELIKKQFGQNYHVSHMSKLMQKIGFSLQKPKTKSYRKEEQAAIKWKEEELPSLKKSE